MEFVAIDVETANVDLASICQIGIALFSDGKIVKEWKTYVDPEDYFDGFNVSIHGIDESTVKGAPLISEISNEIYKFLDNNVTVCHTHFDRIAIKHSFEKYDLRSPKCTWLDSARVARRAWKECAWKGYGLYNICRMIGYEFKHHDALEDAKAAAHVLLEASNKTGLDINNWLKRVEQPIDIKAISTGSAIKRTGNPEGAFFGEIIVFTGTLEISRIKAADLAASIGFQVESGVTKKTTMLVVGDQDIRKLAGHEKSSKHRKAEQLIEEGFSIRILNETDFKELVIISNEIK